MCHISLFCVFSHAAFFFRIFLPGLVWFCSCSVSLNLQHFFLLPVFAAFGHSRLNMLQCNIKSMNTSAGMSVNKNYNICTGSVETCHITSILHIQEHNINNNKDTSCLDTESALSWPPRETNSWRYLCWRLDLFGPTISYAALWLSVSAQLPPTLSQTAATCVNISSTETCRKRENVS